MLQDVIGTRLAGNHPCEYITAICPPSSNEFTKSKWARVSLFRNCHRSKIFKLVRDGSDLKVFQQWSGRLWRWNRPSWSTRHKGLCLVMPTYVKSLPQIFYFLPQVDMNIQTHRVSKKKTLRLFCLISHSCERFRKDFHIGIGMRFYSLFWIENSF